MTATSLLAIVQVSCPIEYSSGTGPAVAFTAGTGLRVLRSGALYQPAPPAPIAGKSRALAGPAVRLPVA
jgi:hypothetical protein